MLSGHRASVCPTNSNTTCSSATARRTRRWCARWRSGCGRTVCSTTLNTQLFNSQPPPGTFRFRDPLNKERRFLPLRLDDAPIKDSGWFRKDDDVYWQFANRTRSRTLATLRDTLPPKLLSGEIGVGEITSSN